MSDDLPTDPKGTDPPQPIDLVDELRTMFTSLLADEVGKLRGDIVNHTAAAAQVAEQLGRLNANYDAVHHQVQRLTERMTDAERRLDALEFKRSNPPDEAA